MWVWNDAQARSLMFDTGAQDHADEVVTLLVEGLPGFALGDPDTQSCPLGRYCINQFRARLPLTPDMAMPPPPFAGSPVQ